MSEEKQEASADTGGGGGGGGGGLSKLVPILLLVNTVVVLGMVGVLFLSFQKEKSKPTVEDIVAGEVKGHAPASDHGKPAEGGHGGGGGGEHGAAGGKKEVDLPDTGKIMPLEPFTVNLSNGAGVTPRYVRMNISIELEKGAPDQEFTVKMPRVRDTIINLLNSKKTTELNAAEGREQLKEELKKAINSFMAQSKVKGVYFTNFAISQ